MKIILLNLMDNHTITPKVLADLLDRNAEFLRKNYLNPMVKEGLIQLFYPNNIKHPNQAYRTTSKGTAWLNAQTDQTNNELI